MDSRGDLVGTELEGRYRLLSRLGEGGMGTVYVAQQILLGSRCAVKVLRGELCHSATARERFLREARIASKLGERNSNIVKVLDLGSLPDGSGFYAMEWLQGENLAATMARAGRLPWPRVRHFALQVCEALASAHAAGIVHRDLKPENCFRVQVGGDPDFIKLLDFGVAHMSEPGSDKLTEQGETVGTAAYMSPEQAAGQGGDHRIDIYALGVIIYEMLTGYQPFEGNNAWQVRARIVSEDPPAMAALCPEADLGPEIEALVTTAMQRRPEQRFASVTELAAVIASVRDDAIQRNPRAPTPAISHRATAYAATLAAGPLVATEPPPRPSIHNLPPPPEPHTLVPPLASAATPSAPTPAPLASRVRSPLLRRGLEIVVIVALTLAIAQWLRSNPAPATQEVSPSVAPTQFDLVKSIPAPSDPAPSVSPQADPPRSPPSPIASPAAAPVDTPTGKQSTPPAGQPQIKPDKQDLEKWQKDVEAEPPKECTDFELGLSIDFYIVVPRNGGTLALKGAVTYPPDGKAAKCSAKVAKRFAGKRFRAASLLHPPPAMLSIYFKRKTKTKAP